MRLFMLGIFSLSVVPWSYNIHTHRLIDLFFIHTENISWILSTRKATDAAARFLKGWRLPEANPLGMLRGG